MSAFNEEIAGQVERLRLAQLAAADPAAATPVFLDRALRLLLRAL